MVCGYTDEDGIKSIVEAYKEVTSLGVDAVIYEHDRVTTIDFLIILMHLAILSLLFILIPMLYTYFPPT